MTNIAETAKKTRLNLHALKSKILLKRLHQVDRRTTAARHLVAWRDELIAALGELSRRSSRLYGAHPTPLACSKRASPPEIPERSTLL
jgi:hypothetical protein